MKNNSFDKNDFSSNLSKRKGYSKLFSKTIIENLIEILCLNINRGHFNLKNIGTFNIINKKERVGRNPKTKIIYKIKSRKSISFKTSKKLDKIINE